MLFQKKVGISGLDSSKGLRRRAWGSGFLVLGPFSPERVLGKSKMRLKRSPVAGYEVSSMFLCILGGSWDLVSKVISPLIGVISNYKCSYLS